MRTSYRFWFWFIWNNIKLWQCCLTFNNESQKQYLRSTGHSISHVIQYQQGLLLIRWWHSMAVIKEVLGQVGMCKLSRIANCQ